MDQLSLFSTGQQKHEWRIYIDGASRNNPGPAGAGIVIYKDNELVQERGFYLGSKTNNQAEYLALLLGIFLVQKLKDKQDHVDIISDSQLLVRQLNGVYKVKNPELHKYVTLARSLLSDSSYDIKHVLRDQNKKADAMANRGVDTKHAVPEGFIQVLNQHNIAW